MTAPYAYRRGPPKAKKARANPEAVLQIAIKQFLIIALPPEIEWTGSLVGTYLSPMARSRAKAMGVRPGWPDLQFLFPDGAVRFIELKVEVGTLSPEQRAFRDRCRASGRDIWACCRSLEDVEFTLRAWGAVLRTSPFANQENA